MFYRTGNIGCTHGGPCNWLSHSSPHSIPHWTPQSHSGPVQGTFTFLNKNPWEYLMNYLPKHTNTNSAHHFRGGCAPQSPHTILKLRHMPMTVRVLLLGGPIPINWTFVGNTRLHPGETGGHTEKANLPAGGAGEGAPSPEQHAEPQPPQGRCVSDEGLTSERAVGNLSPVAQVWLPAALLGQRWPPPRLAAAPTPPHPTRTHTQPLRASQGLRPPFVQNSSQRVLELSYMGMGFLRGSEELQHWG